MLQRIRAFIKKEVVLSAAVVLAVISLFLVHPDRKYADYIDLRTLAILFCLMCVMAGLQKIGVFRRIAEWLLGRVHGNVQVIMILVMLCFFFSMFITNDVALITFVPFTFTVGKMLGEDIYRRMILPVVVLQTVAANLGSMLTPIGNPQNLYLYGLSGMSAWEFIRLMLPYTLLSLMLLAVCCAVFGKRLGKWEDQGKVEIGEAEDALREKGKGKAAVYLILFLVCLLTVARVLPVIWMLVLVAAAVVLTDKKVFLQVDYCLLATFVAFFVFIGNMGRVPAFAEALGRLVVGHEVPAAIVASQFISNVPAALLLSGFTEDVPALIIGVNLGGMGTLIASMASLISYKYVAVEVRRMEMNGGRGKYLGYFTAACICFLAALGILYYIQ